MYHIKGKMQIYSKSNGDAFSQYLEVNYWCLCWNHLLPHKAYKATDNREISRIYDLSSQGWRDNDSIFNNATLAATWLTAKIIWSKYYTCIQSSNFNSGPWTGIESNVQTIKVWDHIELTFLALQGQVYHHSLRLFR